MELNLQDKCALVTAASQGLGRACAEALAKEGAKVVICSRSTNRVSKAADEIASVTGSEVTGFICDLTKHQDIQKLVADTRKYLGRIDILVFNYGNPPPGSFFDLNLKQWREGMGLCFWPAIHLCRPIISEMQERRWGRIIFISSIFAKEPDSNYVVSSTLRAGLLGLAKCLARDMATYGVTINTILPGYFNTPLLRQLAEKEALQLGKNTEQVLQEWTATVPVGQLGDPHKLGKLVTFLSSDLAAHITGTTISMDGDILRGF